MQLSHLSASISSDNVKLQVFQACKIIVNLKLDSGPFGNMSARIPNTEFFWVNPVGITFDRLQLDNMICVDINGRVIAGDSNPHPGTFIHREIYRLRDDVNAIAHTHAEYMVMMSLLGCTIAPYTQLGASLYGDQAIYQGFSGPVQTSDEGREIAAALENKAMVIAKNHGIFCVGTTIEAALWDMVITNTAAKIHLDANVLNIPPSSLSSYDLQKSKIEVREKQCQFMWDNFLSGLTHNGLT